jgi:2-C-methyl-D-erythritol 2,4-cyclodiphosphate synthase
MLYGFSEKKIFFNPKSNNKLVLGNQVVDFLSCQKINCEIVEFAICSAILNGLNISKYDCIIQKFQWELEECFEHDKSVLSLLKEIKDFLKIQRYCINNLAIHFTMQKPKLCQKDINYKFLIRDYIADLFVLDNSDVVVQAGTGEKIGDVGSSNAFIVLCNVSLWQGVMGKTRIGFGFDRHRFHKDFFSSSKILTICNQKVNYNKSIDAHSDGDVVLHGLVNGIFSAVGLGDIGEHFPDSDLEWKDCDSKKFVEYAIRKLHEHQLKIINIEVVLILSEALLEFINQNYKNFIKDSKNILSNLCSLRVENISFLIRSASKDFLEKDEECISNDNGLDSNIKIIVK